MVIFACSATANKKHLTTNQCIHTSKHMSMSAFHPPAKPQKWPCLPVNPRPSSNLQWLSRTPLPKHTHTYRHKEHSKMLLDHQTPCLYASWLKNYSCELQQSPCLETSHGISHTANFNMDQQLTRRANVAGSADHTMLPFVRAWESVQ
jgi:hypothetical protein